MAAEETEEVMDQEVEQQEEQDERPERPEAADMWHRIEYWLEDNRQMVGIVGGAVALVVVAVIFVMVKWLPDRNLKAQREMFYAENAFAKDSFDLALNGNGLNKGFADIKKKYSFTKAANLCNYYMGICYLHKGDYKNAVDYLSGFSTSDPLLGATKLSLIGDAYAQQNKTDDAAGYYRKAASFSDNEEFTPYFLLKLGMYLEMQKKYSEAKEAYTKIKEKYPNTMEGRDIEKYLARVAVQG